MIRAAARELILEGFETDMDLWLPHKFKLVAPFGGSISVEGPQIHVNDDHIVKGIWIGVHKNLACVTVNPFKDLDLKGSFDYADPKFPDDLHAFVAEGLGLWFSYWQLFLEEGQVPEAFLEL